VFLVLVRKSAMGNESSGGSWRNRMEILTHKLIFCEKGFAPG
jgi:hypothetical protein